MKIGIISVFVDPHRRGADHRAPLQPQVGPLIAALVPQDAEIAVTLDTWREPDWEADYDLLFISCLHSDFDRAKQISHYWRRRGAKTVFGGTLAGNYPAVCLPFFDAIVVGDPEGAVPEIVRDFRASALKPLYVSSPYDPARVPVPRVDLTADQQIIPLSLEATRGCPFTCEFCALTGIGTRFHTRPPELVVRDIREGQRMLRGLVPDYKIPAGCFVDNNIGGNLPHLAKLLDAIAPLRLRWGAAITFNCVLDEDVVKALARAGCRILFMGLESFNPETLADMRKHQNAIDETRRVIDRCRRHGMLVVSGMLISTSVDTCAYVESLPARLRESGLHVPAFVAFEAPFPGTPYFHRLAARPEPAFMPGALLRDFTGYTLVARPAREPVATFLDRYKWVLEATFTRRAKIRKLMDDLPKLLWAGRWEAAMVDIVHQYAQARATVDPDRTYIAGTDRPPPETVPLTAADFDSQDEYDAVMSPVQVTDEDGRVLPAWTRSVRVFDARGRLSAAVLRLAAAPAL